MTESSKNEMNMRCARREQESELIPKQQTNYRCNAVASVGWASALGANLRQINSGKECQKASKKEI
jgi:hypothetical protein